MRLKILHTNDIHGTLNFERVGALKRLREEVDLYVDSGDLIKAGNLAIPLKADAGWAALAELCCSASVMGNRESHVLESAWRKKIEGARHPLLCGNLRDRSGQSPLPRSLVTESAGLRIGIVSAMVPMVTSRMKTQAASAFLWDSPIDSIREQVAGIRPSCDVLIALTHIGFRADCELAEAVPELDMIFGGHSHTVLQAPELRNRVWIAQGGSHGRYAGVYEWDGESLRGGLRPLTAGSP